MTEANPPAFMDGTISPAEHARRMLQGIMGPGVARGPIGALTGDLAVSEHAGTPGMNVDVAAGGAFVAGTSTLWQGTYYVENQAPVTLTIATSNPTNPRKDIVVARVRENFYDSSGVNAWDLAVITGTAAASPVAPAVPANCLLLATVDVLAAAVSITNARITSARALARPWSAAWGPVAAPAVATATQSSISGVVNLTSLAVTFVAVAGRRYRVHGSTLMQGTNANASGSLVIADGAGTQLQRRDTGTMSLPTVPVAIAVEVYTTPAAGSTTYRLRANLATGTGTISSVASGNIPALISVDDVGPAA